MGKFRLILLVLFCFVLAGSAYELRIWEDVDGNQYEGRFLRELFGKLTIELEDGGTKTFTLEQLSDIDQKYLRVKVPPKMEVVVTHKSTQRPPRPSGGAYRVEIVSDHELTVEITKKTQRPFTSRLKAEIFMFAEEYSHGEYVLMDKTDRQFIMPTVTKGSMVTLKSRRVKMWKAQANLMDGYIGMEYDGYLVVISTVLDDEIVHIESSLPSFIEDPEVIQNLRELYVQGAPSWFSRFFDKTGRKIPPPRPPEP